MDVPRGYISKVYAPVPGDIEANVVITREGVQVAAITVTADGGIVEITLPYAAVHKSGLIEAEITFEVDTKTYTNRIPINVYTPYLELHEIKKIMGSATPDDKCWEAEESARLVINAHCGQEFGYFEGTHEVMSNYDTALMTPQRMIRIDKIVEGSIVRFDRSSGTEDNFLGRGNFEITGSGWYLKRPRWSSDVWDGEWTMTSSDPIRPPALTSASGFVNDVRYKITGAFGYEAVPAPVKEAAALLTNDYACADTEYRERYLESIKSADWRLQFNTGAYKRTGNARADRLLSPFVVNRMLIV